MAEQRADDDRGAAVFDLVQEVVRRVHDVARSRAPTTGGISISIGRWHLGSLFAEVDAFAFGDERRQLRVRFRRLKNGRRVTVQIGVKDGDGWSSGLPDLPIFRDDDPAEKVSWNVVQNAMEEGLGVRLRGRKPSGPHRSVSRWWASARRGVVRRALDAAHEALRRGNEIAARKLFERVQGADTWMIDGSTPPAATAVMLLLCLHRHGLTDISYRRRRASTRSLMT